MEATYAERQPGDLSRSQADITRAREVLGYEPAVDVRSGLEKTFAHLAEESRVA